MQLTRVTGCGTEELRRHGLLGGAVPGGRGRVVEHAHRARRLHGRDPFRRLSRAPRHLAQHPPAAPGPPGRGRVSCGTNRISNVRFESYDYRLTDKGRDLWPVLTTMRQWGDKSMPAPDGPLLWWSPTSSVRPSDGRRRTRVSFVRGEGGARDVKAAHGARPTPRATAPGRTFMTRAGGPSPGTTAPTCLMSRP